MPICLPADWQECGQPDADDWDETLEQVVPSVPDTPETLDSRDSRRDSRRSQRSSQHGREEINVWSGLGVGGSVGSGKMQIKNDAVLKTAF